MMPAMTPMSVQDLVLSFVLVVWGALVHAQVIHAPPHWYVNGAHPDGWLELRPVLGSPDDTGREDYSTDTRRRVARLYCTGGATPRQDGLKAWCQR